MQRDVLRELAQLVRLAEPEGHNLGAFVAGHAGELAPLLQSTEHELQAAIHEPDGALVDRLRARLDLALERDRQHRNEHDVDRARRAAVELERTARWFERGVILDVDLVLGDLLADPMCRTVTFELPKSAVCISTVLLRRARLLRRVYLDLASFVNEEAIGFRWKGGRGALNFYGMKTNPRAEHALVVQLPPRRARPPILLGDVLAEIGFGS